MQTQILPLLLTLIFFMTGCEKAPWPQPEIQGNDPIYTEPAGCQPDFDYYVTRGNNNYWYFQGIYSGEGPILQLYWMINGEIVQEADYALMTYSVQLDPDQRYEVCLTFFDEKGCHRQCATVGSAQIMSPQEEPYKIKGLNNMQNISL